jgi:hypothetical protein
LSLAAFAGLLGFDDVTAVSEDIVTKLNPFGRHVAENHVIFDKDPVRDRVIHLHVNVIFISQHPEFLHDLAVDFCSDFPGTLRSFNPAGKLTELRQGVAWQYFPRIDICIS